MVEHGGSSAGSYLADPTSPIPSHCAVSILFKSVPVHQLSWLALLRVKYPSFTSVPNCRFCNVILLTGLFAVLKVYATGSIFANVRYYGSLYMQTVYFNHLISYMRVPIVCLLAVGYFRVK